MQKLRAFVMPCAALAFLLRSRFHPKMAYFWRFSVVQSYQSLALFCWRTASGTGLARVYRVVTDLGSHFGCT